MKAVKIGNKTFLPKEKLGEGSFGNVFKVDFDGNEYALKVIENKEGISSLRELDIMSRFDHPNLMKSKKIFADYIDDSSNVGILMDIADRDLYKAMYDKNFTINERLKVLHQISQGLKFLHETEYLHLDIKPLNILIVQGNAKLTDFGLSVKMENGSKYYPIELITIDHRPIEILEGDKLYSPASDVWALGMTFIEVLSGGKNIFLKLTKDEYKKPIIIDIIRNKLSPSNIKETLNKLLKLNGKLKDDAIKIITKMLKFNPSSRATLNDVLISPLFNNFVNTKKGNVNSVIIHSPKFCDVMIYEGFDVLVRLCTRIPVKLETFFLAVDIYQRSLAHRHQLSEDSEENYTDTVFSACLSLYMSIKMIESFYSDAVVITKLAGDKFPSNYILLGESVLVNAWKGAIYPPNLFTSSTTFRRLLEAFNLSRDCRIYRYINLPEWKKLNDIEEKNEGKYNKDTSFNLFLKQTPYFGYLQDDTILEYIDKLYIEDGKREI